MSRSDLSQPVRQADVVDQLVERCADAFRRASVGATAARVLSFAALADAETHTAREFANGLSVSASAMSGAARELEGMSVFQRQRRKGARADSFSLRVPRDQLWQHILAARAERLLRAHSITLAFGARRLDREDHVLLRLHEISSSLAQPREGSSAGTTTSTRPETQSCLCIAVALEGDVIA